MDVSFTPKSVMWQEDGAYCFTFFCALCQNGHTTGLIGSASTRDALAFAQQEARPYFNRCHICGRWVCDTHYKEAVMACTHCAAGGIANGGPDNQ